MEVLYVAYFDVTSRNESSGEAGAFSALLDDAAAWLVYRTETSPEEIDLDTDGSFSRMNGGEATWTSLVNGESRATRVLVRQPADAGIVFETRITLALLHGNVTVRVSLARESVVPGLSPVAAPVIVQPTFVLDIAMDERIALSAEGAVQDGLYLLIHSDAEAREVVQALRNPVRLPILVMHPQNQGQWEAAKTAARRLVGLVRVVVAGYRFTRIISSELPEVLVPSGGAVLVWSRLSSPPRLFSRGELLALGEGGFRRALMEQLAGLSVRGRGSDIAWSRMRQMSLSEGAAEAAKRALEAASTGDVAGQIEALTNQIARISEQLADAEDLTNSYASDAARAKDELQISEQGRNEAEAKAGALRYQIGQMGEKSAESTAVSLDDVPLLESKEANATFAFLEERSQGRITFTPNAATSWKKSSLTNYEQMTEALVNLTLLANALYDSSKPTPDIDRRTDDWIQAEFGIIVSFHDSAMETHKKASDTFSFEGGSWNNVPHVKVTDAVSWGQVARIHFAQDEKGGRIIVNHVGDKLYR
jgi:hypothetical protein